MGEPDLRNRIEELLSPDHDEDRLSRAVNLLLLWLIVANIVAIVLESLPTLRESHKLWFDSFETVSVMVFSLEYLARLASGAQGLRGRARLALRPMFIVDLLAVVPWYLPYLGADLRILRAFRLLRVLRVLRVGRYSSAMRRLARTLEHSQSELSATSSIAVVLMVIAASGMYYAEHEAQPDAFSSIPAALWWAVVTLTTVGYGDVYPVTPIGKCLAGIIAALGIGLFALPTAILGTSFMRAVEEGDRAPCPHCGKRADEQVDPVSPEASG